jgi:hypothetical protein
MPNDYVVVNRIVIDLVTGLDSAALTRETTGAHWGGAP